MKKLQQTAGTRQPIDPAAKFAALYKERTGRDLPIPALEPAQLEPSACPAPPRSSARRAPPTISPPPRLSAAQRRQRDAARKRALRERRARAEAEREAKTYERFRARLAAAGASFDETPPQIPGWIWRLAWTVVGDETGGAARMFLRRMQTKNGAAVGAILRAIFGDEAGDEIPSAESWSSLHVRRCCAVGLAIVHLAKPHAKRGPWGSQAAGVPLGALCSMLHNPFDLRPAMPRRSVPGARNPSQRLRRPGTPHENTLTGTHNAARGEYGYLVRLARAGLFRSHQLPASQAKPWEIGPTGHAFARYDVITPNPERTTNDEQAGRVADLAGLAELAVSTWRAPSTADARAAPA